MVAKRTSKPLKRYLLTKGKQNRYSASNKDLKRGFYKWLKCQLVLSKERQHQSNIITEILKKKTGKQNTIITSIENEKRIINICNRLTFERNMTSVLAKKCNDMMPLKKENIEELMIISRKYNMRKRYIRSMKSSYRRERKMIWI